MQASNSISPEKYLSSIDQMIFEEIRHKKFLHLVFHASPQVVDKDDWLVLTLYTCAWLLASNQSVLAASRDSIEVIIDAFAYIKGQKVQSIYLDPETLEVRLAFEGDNILYLFPVSYRREEIMHWGYIQPDVQVTFGPGTSWNYKSR